MKADNNVIIENEVIHHEIQVITNIIHRISNLSFIIKGWSITLLGGIVTYLFTSGKITNFSYIFSLLSIIPIILFWYLDARYYQIEMIFRLWYDFLIIETRGRSMQYKYIINPKDIKDIFTSQVLQSKNTQIPSLFYCLFNKTICPIYASLLLIILVQLIYAFIVEYH